MEIIGVTVYLDNNIPEYMDGICRVGMVETVDENGKIHTHDDLVDNAEFHSDGELLTSVAERLNVDPAIVEIDGYDADI